MTPDSRIYVAGHSGLAGSAILRRLWTGGYRNTVTRSHAELDLSDQRRVVDFFDRERPEYVFLAAGRVGGISANDRYRAEFIYQNLAIQLNVIHTAYTHGVRKLAFLGSSCIYPKLASQPITEDQLLTGRLEPTNEPYAVAKIAGIKMCDAYHRQYGSNFISLMPTNLYGTGDHYDPENSHVLPALMHKMHEARQRGDDRIVIWGSGTSRREFLYSDDLADAAVHLMEHYDALDIGECINVGTGFDHTIAELATLIAETVGFRGRFVFDTGRPDGTPRKLLNVSRLRALGWKARTGLAEGLARTYHDYRSRFERVRVRAC